jgi:hypothetical protein
VFGDHVHQRIAAGPDSGQLGPEVVEQACTECEARLDAVELRRDPEVGLEQEADALRVRRPAEIEVDALARYAELLGETECALSHVHVRHVRSGMANA